MTDFYLHGRRHLEFLIRLLIGWCLLMRLESRFGHLTWDPAFWLVKSGRVVEIRFTDWLENIWASITTVNACYLSWGKAQRTKLSQAYFYVISIYLNFIDSVSCHWLSSKYHDASAVQTIFYSLAAVQLPCLLRLGEQKIKVFFKNTVVENYTIMKKKTHFTLIQSIVIVFGMS